MEEKYKITVSYEGLLDFYETNEVLLSSFKNLIYLSDESGCYLGVTTRVYEGLPSNGLSDSELEEKLIKELRLVSGDEGLTVHLFK